MLLNARWEPHFPLSDSPGRGLLAQQHARVDGGLERLPRSDLLAPGARHRSAGNPGQRRARTSRQNHPGRGTSSPAREARS
ncbi:hypothetical protein ACL02O_05770 [Micromonospora sp. MS34]|uniref:hypothetical protein n=1 Tax=Micromonospora sp. MS34 TaxID=3385971 RepID=UPI00399F5988